MKITRLLNLPVTIMALLLCSISASPAQILYSQLVATNPPRHQLRQVNGDGSGETAFNLPFSDVLHPAWSRDSGLVAISAPIPNRPNDRSYNVYAINPANGGIQAITAHQLNPPDPQTGAYNFGVALYKAFSPDRRAIAVSSIIVNGEAGANGERTTPVLEIYSTAPPGPGANLFMVHRSTERSPVTHHALEGVDWHPSANVLVTPIESRAPYLSDPSRAGQVTALALVEPGNLSIDNQRFRQITFPRADQGSTTNDGFIWGEHDIQPRFSPNGAAVAYVRSFKNLSASRGGQDPNFQSIRILNLNTGGESEVISFRQGMYVTALDWSPDGNALVFSLGQQPTGINGPAQTAIPESSEVYIISVDSTGLRRLRGPGANTPAWRPFAAPGGNTPTGNNIAVQSPSGDASVFFPGVSQAGNTSFTPINPASAGAPPQGYTILNNAPAYDISTTAAFTGPVTVCHAVPGITNEEEFARVRILHGENGQLVDRTIRAPDSPAPNFSTRTVCARVESLSPFVTALAPPTARSGVLANISTRLRIGTDDNALIGGFIITGDQPKTVILRALGPSLGAAGVQDALQDPTAELFQGGTVVAMNDNWRQAPNANQIPPGFEPGDERECVIVITLNPGSYTAVVRGVGGQTGIGLIEAYDLNSGSSSQLANISTRGAVQSGQNVMIGGFIITAGDGGARVLLRGIGPSLGGAGLAGALQDPAMELYDGNGTIVAGNNNWRDTQAGDIEATTIPPGDDREAAIVATLAPGPYTAVVRGNGDSSGVALVEVYQLR